MNDGTAWQLKIFNKTLKKKEKLRIIRRLLPDLTGKRCLDLGCSRGTISYFLRREGGVWCHEDLDYANVRSTHDLVGAATAVISSRTIPHSDDCFDIIVSLDILEHIHDDMGFMREMARVLKPGGRLILSTPASGPIYLLNRLKNKVGLTPDQYGHVVEGYCREDLETMLEQVNMRIIRSTTYSRFFTELVEMCINLVFVKFLAKPGNSDKRDGHITPGSAAEVAKYKKQLAVYSVVYPFLWLFTRLDGLLQWQKGYATLLVAEKP